MANVEDFDEALGALDESDLRVRAVKAERALTEANALVRSQERELEQARVALDRIAQVRQRDLVVPEWLTSDTGDGSDDHHGTPVLMLSDLHLDEVVDLMEMDGVNEYGREIAEARLQRVVDGTIRMVRDHVSGIEVDGIVVPLAGDILTGDIHAELQRTNEAPVQASVVHWVPKLASALTHLADEFGHVFVPTCDGNHDRDPMNKRTPNKKRTQSSYAWIIYNWLADTLKDDERIDFSISVSPEQRFDVYDTRFLLTHGDAFRSQGGVGGLYPALLKYLLRKHQAYSALRNDFDYALLGHWHQLLWGQDFVVNGSLKGWDEYARHLGFAPEPARQALFIVTPERGITQQMPVYAE